MKRNQEISVFQLEIQRCLELGPIKQPHLFDGIHTEPANAMNTLRLLAKLDYAAAVLLCSHAMDMRHLCDGMAHGLIHCSLGHLPAMDV
ncbi:hypothetical protein D3C72_2231340 [compost metagenome]